MRKQVDKIKVSAGEDLLAFIPHMVGYWPREQHCVHRHGRARCCGPPCAWTCPRTSHGDDGPLCRDRRPPDWPATERPTAASSPSSAGEDWLDPGHCPQTESIGELRKALAGAGLPVRDAWYVGTGHWRSLECTDGQCCPWPGQGQRLHQGELCQRRVHLPWQHGAGKSPGANRAANSRHGRGFRGGPLPAAGESYREPLPAPGSAAQQLARDPRRMGVQP